MLMPSAPTSHNADGLVLVPVRDLPIDAEPGYTMKDADGKFFGLVVTVEEPGSGEALLLPTDGATVRVDVNMCLSATVAVDTITFHLAL